MLSPCTPLSRRNWQGDLNDVEMMYKRALEQDPNHVDTLNNYGLLLHKSKKDILAAEEMYRCAAVPRI